MTKGEETKAAVLSEALDMASIEGFEGLSIGALAARTGMSKSGLFAHFGSKEQLQLATLQTGVSRFTEVVIDRALQAPRGLGRVQALFENWLEWATKLGPSGGCVLLAASVEWDDKEGPVRDYLVKAQNNWLAVLAGAAKRAVGTKEFREDLDCELFANELNATYLNFHMATRLLRDPKARDRARQAFARLLEDARC